MIYLSTLINRGTCESEKSAILSHCDSQMEQELVKVRRCTEEKSSLNSKLNDLQWEIEKLKRSNSDLETKNSKLNQDIIESNSKLNSFEKENEQLKVNIENLKDLHEKAQEKININEQQEKNHIHEMPIPDNVNVNNNYNHNANKNKTQNIQKQQNSIKRNNKKQSNKTNSNDENENENENKQKKNEHDVDHSDKLNDAPVIIDDHKSNPLVKNNGQLTPPSNIGGVIGKDLVTNNDVNDNDNENPYARNQVSLQSAPVGIAVVILCYNRPDYLHRTLESVMRFVNIWFILWTCFLACAMFACHVILQQKNECFTTNKISVVPSVEFPVFVSQQGYDSKVTNVIESYTKQKKLYHLGFDYEKDVRC